MPRKARESKRVEAPTAESQLFSRVIALEKKVNALQEDSSVMQRSLNQLQVRDHIEVMQACAPPLDREINAVKAVSDVLRDLSPEVQRRVLAYVSEKHELFS